MVKTDDISLWVVRHGLRIDFIDDNWVKTAKNPYNPPLAPKGFLQAEEAALRLESEKIDYIFASPFLRTLQTANIIAEKVGLDFNVEPGLTEWLKPSEYGCMPDLYNLKDLKLDFPHINLNYKPYVIPEYPETKEALDDRAKEAVNKIISKYKANVLLISHGSPIKSIFKALLDYEPEDYQTMGSVSRFDLSEKNWDLAIDGDTSHLSVLDTRKRAFYNQRAKNGQE